MKITFPPRRIMTGVDLSKPSLTALETALELGRAFRAKLSVEYVEQPPPPPAGPGVETAAIISAEADLEAFRGKWRERVASLAGPEARLSIERGLPEAVLARRAAARSADLVVLGTHGRRGSERFFLGSVAESVVHRARVPVLTVRAGAAPRFKSILAPCHMHRYADEALFYALRFAEKLGAAVTVLYVPPKGEWELDAELKLRMHLEETFGSQHARDLRLLVKTGDAREEILREASSGAYDLIALSAHRRGTLSDLALGTTAERLIRRCTSPVLAVPAPSPSAATRAVAAAKGAALHPPLL